MNLAPRSGRRAWRSGDSVPEHQIREAWWTEELSDKLEAQVLDAFRGFLTGSDHRTRMDRRLGAKDLPAAMGAARFGLHALPHSLAPAQRRRRRSHPADGRSPTRGYADPRHRRMVA